MHIAASAHYACVHVVIARRYGLQVRRRPHRIVLSHLSSHWHSPFGFLRHCEIFTERVYMLRRCLHILVRRRDASTQDFVEHHSIYPVHAWVRIL